MSGQTCFMAQGFRFEMDVPVPSIFVLEVVVSQEYRVGDVRA
jgi:hypothetical protein